MFKLRPRESFVITVLVFSLVPRANADLIAAEDFESGATGWSDNTTTTEAGTRFLGRHGGTGGSQSLFKTFALSGNQTQVNIQFDFYEIDSWDIEEFTVFVDDVAVATDQFQWFRFDDPAAAIPLLGDGSTDLGFGIIGAPDQTYRYSFDINSTASSIKLGFGTNLDQATSDESWGIDNVLLNDDLTAVPEPSSCLYLLLALMLGVGFRKRAGSSNSC